MTWVSLSAALTVASVGLMSFVLKNLSPDFFTLPTQSVTKATRDKTAAPPWQPGILDIHHLYVGSSVSTFVVMPDGTTVLIDGGEVDVQWQQSWWNSLGPPYNELKALYPFPNESKTTVGWIIEYMKEFWPWESHAEMVLDYLLLTHFHSDHFGGATGKNSQSNRGNYSLVGIPALADQISIRKLIDRGYPKYDFPRDLASVGDPSISNYLSFVRSRKDSISFEQFRVGSTEQIKLQHSPDVYDFEVKVIKNAMQVLDPITHETVVIDGTVVDDRGNWNENILSSAIVIRYGDFLYYEGGDQEVVRNENGDIILDTVGPTAQAAGRVDAATLNHHGHGITEEFVKMLDPPVAILQGWCSDQPPQKSMELLSRSVDGTSKPRQIFATHVFQQRLDSLGPILSDLFTSVSGHVLVRVQPKEKDASVKQTFEIFVLDGDRKIKSYHGHYSVLRKERIRED